MNEIETPMENTVLHIAAWYGNNEIVNLVIERVPKLLFKFNKNNDSAFHVAANGGHISTVEKLLANYVNIERHDIKMAWLEYTKKNKDDQEDYDEKSNMEDLLNFVKEKNVRGNTMLHEAMLSDKSNMSRGMIFKVCELYKTEDLSGYSLANSCYEFALDIINHAKESVLFLAVVKGDKDAVELILKNCPQNVKPEGLSPVGAAILMQKHNNASYGGHVEVVKKLLEYCPDPTEMLDTSHKRNILHVASKYGKYEVVQYILQSQIPGLDKMINQKDNKGDTPLHLAARSCHPTTVYYLVNQSKERVKLDLVNQNNETALDIVTTLFELDKSSLRQHLTWIALKSAGAQKSSTPIAACLAVPGEAEGKAHSLCHAMFHAFIIFITISLFSSISATIILFWATLGLTELVTFTLKMVMPLLGIALISLSLAFMASLYTVISELTWLSNVSLVMALIFIAVVIALYMLSFLPSSSTSKPLRGGCETKLNFQDVINSMEKEGEKGEFEFGAYVGSVSMMWEEVAVS
ncbi:protein ACCELERATED CELL DEATH 6 [Medicago truncatula]|uniref:protein ACCELERATED CELL DEATH 6 n=1 Tax=Medicago truncatula TaxID=3880 RepID=UPI001967C3B2|nr:protein ACCELERATED CELL DEATH 6 [Medicago truncatula]